ncbi:hypothetical protein BV22DRAFT_998470, partial [Leucogyrophana mollusca]
YNIHRSMMIQKSKVFADMFTLPTENIKDVQGTHEENPIVLHGDITSVMFDDLLDWIYKIDWHPMITPSYPERFLVNILKLSTMWDIQSENHERMIGFKTYIILAKAKEFVEHERKLIASIPPPMAFVQPLECQQHNDCRAAWRELWWKKVAKAMLHPTVPMLLEGAATYVE